MKSISNKDILLYYWRHAWNHKRFTIPLLITRPLVQFVYNIWPAIIVAGILNRISSRDFTEGQLWASFGTELATYAFAVVMGGIFLWRFIIFLIWKLEMNVIREINQEVFNHLMTMSADFHANRFGGSLVSQTNKLAGSYLRLADTVIFQVIGLISAFIYTFIILWPRSPLTVVLLFSFSIFFILIAIRITKSIRELNFKESKASTRQTGFLADAVTNIMAIKSFSSSTYEKQRFAEATDVTFNATHKLMASNIQKDFIFSSTTSAISFVTLAAAIYAVVSFNADVATIYLIVTFTAIIADQLWQFSQNSLRNFNRATGDAKEMAEILRLKPGVEDPVHPSMLAMNRGAIRFNAVSFAYSDNTEDLLFKNLSLSFKPGEKIGLVGHSGGGKTTITKLIMRFMDISKGSIKIDGQDIKDVTQDDLRSKIAYVPQEPLLFHRSLSENIAYSNPGASMQEIKAIARLAHADEFIAGLKDGYNTLVGERGIKLSGGQRQRVAIARAMLKNAPILVLDEATSALDSESEVLIQDALWKLMEGRTAIVIAHRLSTIQKMDRILVMDQGAIVEEGTHKELIRKNGIYANLWDHQTGGFLEE